MPKFPRVLAASILSLLVAPVALAGPPTRVWLIGVPSGNADDFEHENQGDDFFYLHPGDYTTVAGWDTVTNSYTLYGEVVTVAEPISDPDNAAIGFERALVAGNEDTINIFFQLNGSQLRPDAKYQFDAIVSGGNSSHLITLGFNGQEFMSFESFGQGAGRYRQVFSFDELNPNLGSNVLTLRTENTASGNYLTFDYFKLTLIDPNVIFALGADDNSNVDFEAEGDSRNDPKFYVHAGDYTNVSGSTGAGEVALTPELEVAAAATAGLPRALVPTRPKVDLFFQLTPEEAAAEMLRFEADLFSLAGGSTHDLRFSINGVVLGELIGVNSNRLATFDFLSSLVNPGGNVISIEKIGGTGGASGEWIQFDYLQLSTIPEPSSAALLGLGAIGLGMIRRRRA